MCAWHASSRLHTQVSEDSAHACTPPQVDKVVQLYEVMMTRHTVMVVGQTGGGKTVIINTLARAQVRVCVWMCTCVRVCV